MASFPELLDIGVMGHCFHAEVCMRAGFECYQGGKCTDRSVCMGGCPICPQIVLCGRKERDTSSNEY